MRIAIAILISVLAMLPASNVGVWAQAGSGSFLNPFPENNRYRVEVWGDAMSSGLLDGLGQLQDPEARLEILKKHRWMSGLLRVDVDEEAKSIEAGLATGAPDIAVFMLGAADRVSLRRDGQRVGIGSTEWKVEYARRLDLVMRTFRKRSVGVFWVGLPVMRRNDANDHAEMLNELIRSRALANGVRFIDIFASFADPDKSYDAHGPDLDGKIRLLRDNDGVHFTGSGYRKLAYFVQRELKRAAVQAWEERTIPLAGAEAEQERIRPPTTVKLSSLVKPGNNGPAGQAGTSKPRLALKPLATPTPTEGGVEAENSQITLKSVGAQGREESVTLEILRPAIPATVVSLLVRRQSENKASQVGDSVMTEILGGLTVVSSVTPMNDAAAGNRRRQSPTASPLHRVLQKGEALPPKPGRADEMPWPRPEPELDRRRLAVKPIIIRSDGVRPPDAAPAALLGDPNDPPLPRRPYFLPRGR